MTPAEKLQSLIDAANSTTTLSDDNMTDAVVSLISGYGKGGGKTATVTVTAPTGSIVTLTDGIETLTTVETDGVWVFSEVPYGIWVAVGIFKGEQTAKEITVVGDVSLTISFAKDLILLNGNSVLDNGAYDIALKQAFGTTGTAVGKFTDNGLLFNTSAVYGYFPDHATEIDAFSICFWYKPLNRSKQFAVPFIFFVGDHGVSCSFGTNVNALQLDNSSNRINFSFRTALNIWTFFSITYDGTKLRMYADGAKIAELPCAINGVPKGIRIGNTADVNFDNFNIININSTSASQCIEGIISDFVITDACIWDGGSHAIPDKPYPYRGY